MTNGKKIGKCRLCGADYSVFFIASKSLRNAMVKHGVCSRCASWITRKKDPSAREETIDGIVYRIYPYRKTVAPGDFLGGGGRIRYIMDLSTYTCWKSNDVWAVGPPPKPFEKPDTAAFTNKDAYKAFKDGEFECMGVACLDRYTCAMYFSEKMEKNGAVNRIPEGWIDGGERCRTYININKADKTVLEWRRKKQCEKRR